MNYFLFLLTVVTIKPVFAHGENLPGPHGGIIRMPGSFHTELVKTAQPDQFKVYLLDIQFKNPTVEKSKVSVEVRGGKRVTINCSPKVDHFECSLPKGSLPNKGHLELSSERNGVQAGIARYDLPL